jgi:hypothetical protein
MYDEGQDGYDAIHRLCIERVFSAIPLYLCLAKIRSGCQMCVLLLLKSP